MTIERSAEPAVIIDSNDGTSTVSAGTNLDGVTIIDSNDGTNISAGEIKDTVGIIDSNDGPNAVSPGPNLDGVTIIDSNDGTNISAGEIKDTVSIIDSNDEPNAVSAGPNFDGVSIIDSNDEVATIDPNDGVVIIDSNDGASSEAIISSNDGSEMKDSGLNAPDGMTRPEIFDPQMPDATPEAEDPSSKITDSMSNSEGMPLGSIEAMVQDIPETAEPALVDSSDEGSDLPQPPDLNDYITITTDADGNRVMTVDDDAFDTAMAEYIALLTGVEQEEVGLESSDSSGESADFPQEPNINDYITYTTDVDGKKVMSVDHDAFAAAMEEYLAMKSGSKPEEVGQDTSDASDEIQEKIDELRNRMSELQIMIAGQRTCLSRLLILFSYGKPQPIGPISMVVYHDAFPVVIYEKQGDGNYQTVSYGVVDNFAHAGQLIPRVQANCISLENDLNELADDVQVLIENKAEQEFEDLMNSAEENGGIIRDINT